MQFNFPAVVSLVSFYVFGVPIAVVLMFPANWRLFGYWTGYLTGSVLQLLATLVYVLMINWRAIVEKQAAASEAKTTDELLGAEQPNRSFHDGEELPLIDEVLCLLLSLLCFQCVFIYCKLEQEFISLRIREGKALSRLWNNVQYSRVATIHKRFQNSVTQLLIPQLHTPVNFH